MTQAPTKRQQELQRAIALHKQGAVDEAATIYKTLLKTDAKNFDLLHLLGMVHIQQGQPDLAVPRLQAALRLQPQSVAALSNLGTALVAVNRHAEAIEKFDSIIAIKPDYADAHARKALALLMSAKAEQAVAAYDRALALQPKEGGWMNNRASALRDLGRFEDALTGFDVALAINPNHIEALVNKGNVLRDLKRPQDAIASYDLALSLDGKNAEALMNRAKALEESGQVAEALAAYDAVLKVNPAMNEAVFLRAFLLQKENRMDEALVGYQAVLAANPKHAEALLNRGVIEQSRMQLPQALESYAAAIAIKPQDIGGHVNLGNLLQQLRRYDAAIDSYNNALAINPDHVGALVYRGGAYHALNRIAEAVADYDRAYVLDPAYPNLAGLRLHLKMQSCDWSAWGDVAPMLADLRAGKKVTSPFPLVALPATAKDQFDCTRDYAAERYPPLAPLWQGEKYKHDKIRIGYLSADLHRHATAYLMAGMFEAHDKGQFETYAFSYGQDDGSDLRARLVAAFDHFIDVSRMSDTEVAALMREKEIDIAVDLKGFTQEARPNIVARRPAPLQVSYIGYPGTMASPYIDYIVADRRVLPPEIATHFAEKVIWLPDSYQVNDRARVIAEPRPTRAALGLPENAFVYCCFNNNYKITPDIFDIWMDILKSVPDAVFWLFTGNDVASANLRREAVARSVDAARLIFAPKIKLEDHLARLSAADLFLDNLPCNAHTTASDALWAGLPVLTCAGQTFAGRVAASLLTAIDMPEMIVEGLDAYKQTAIDLARDAARLSGLREKLAANRLTTALFDTELSTRHLESAYRHIWQRWQDGQTPESFDVPRIQK